MTNYTNHGSVASTTAWTTDYDGSRLLGTGIGPSPHLLCPVCGDINIHLTGVAMSGDDPENLGDGYAGTKTLESLGAVARSPRTGLPVGMVEPSRLGENRLVFALYGYCEMGHDFVVNFQQYKGNTFITAQGVAALASLSEME